MIALSKVPASISAEKISTRFRVQRFAQPIWSNDFLNLTLRQLDLEMPPQMFRDQADDSVGDPEAALQADSLLTPEGERHLFRQYNFCKYQLEKLRQSSPSASLNGRAGEIEELEHRATRSREILIQCNLRLVVGIAHKLRVGEVEADELIAEGNLILMNAIDKFDTGRGFRFSTYATHAIQRHFFRWLKRRQRRSQKEFLSAPEDLSRVAHPLQVESELDVGLAKQLIGRMEERLTPREYEILIKRFGLNGHPAETLKSIADSLSLSKERVRQLQLSALKKLEMMATSLQKQREIGEFVNQGTLTI